MKKKKLKLGKLNLSKSSIASLGKAQGVVGGTVGPFDTIGCPPPPSAGCPPPTGGGTQYPACQATDVACGSAWNPTRCNCDPGGGGVTSPYDVNGNAM